MYESCTMLQRELICLANSYKLGGRCVAGLATDGSGWIRLANAKVKDGVLFPSDYTFAAHGEAQPLDVLCAAVSGPKPEIHHPEDWAIVAGSPWQLRHRPMPDPLASCLRAALRNESDLLQGDKDHVLFEDFMRSPAKASLALIAPPRLYLYREAEKGGKTRVRGRFHLGPRQTWYDLGVTDPRWKETILRDGDRDLIQAEQPFVLTISLSEPYQRKCFKLIAAVIALTDNVLAGVIR